jgi:hypothetical protein
MAFASLPPELRRLIYYSSYTEVMHDDITSIGPVMPSCTCLQHPWMSVCRESRQEWLELVGRKHRLYLHSSHVFSFLPQHLEWLASTSVDLIAHVRHLRICYKSPGGRTFRLIMLDFSPDARVTADCIHSIRHGLGDSNDRAQVTEEVRSLFDAFPRQKGRPILEKNGLARMLEIADLGLKCSREIDELDHILGISDKLPIQGTTNSS